ncbi:hypothetical protein L9F63_018492, partial [Diploptera punctata]
SRHLIETPCKVKQKAMDLGLCTVKHKAQGLKSSGFESLNVNSPQSEAQSLNYKVLEPLNNE